MLCGSGRYDTIEFMAHWDGLLSKYIEHVLVLASDGVSEESWLHFQMLRIERGLISDVNLRGGNYITTEVFPSNLCIEEIIEERSRQPIK
jgi:hypothetical protein